MNLTAQAMSAVGRSHTIAVYVIESFLPLKAQRQSVPERKELGCHCCCTLYSMISARHTGNPQRERNMSTKGFSLAVRCLEIVTIFLCGCQHWPLQCPFRAEFPSRGRAPCPCSRTPGAETSVKQAYKASCNN